MSEFFDIEDFLNNLEQRILKCEKLINAMGTTNNNREFEDKHKNSDGNNTNNSMNSIQNRLAIGQNSLMASLENDIQHLDKIKDDNQLSINSKLDLIENILKKIYSLGPLENWLSNYESIKTYLEMDSVDFESSLLTLDIRKAYIKEHYEEFKRMRDQLKELEDLLPFVNQELDINSIKNTKKRLSELEYRERKIGYETQILWEGLQKLSFSYSNFIFKYNTLSINE